LPVVEGIFLFEKIKKIMFDPGSALENGVRNSATTPRKMANASRQKPTPPLATGNEPEIGTKPFCERNMPKLASAVWVCCPVGQ